MRERDLKELELMLWVQLMHKLGNVVHVLPLDDQDEIIGCKLKALFKGLFYQSIF